MATGKALAPLIAAGLCCLAALPSAAGDLHIGPVTAYVEANVRPWMSDPRIVEELKRQNRLNAHLSPADINRLDAAWRAERTGTVQSLIETVAKSPLSLFLKQKQAASNGVITEIMIIDAKGLSIAQSEIGSDYWQGDEPKWQKTYLAGNSDLFVDRAERDESTQMLQSQASMAITDGQTGKPLGTIMVGINLSAL